ncbi:MAG: hypothetical protein ISQ13_03195 [Candidatus Margulisbacteria bacterium]|nr:hypothetical protein [Candidatus Margulisiibacteriota bacterium]
MTSKLFAVALIGLMPFMAISHDKNSSRADLFKNELKASDELLQTIAAIDNKYRSEYQKLSAEIKFHESELASLVRIKPFNEDKAKQILKKLYNSESEIKLYSIRHHLEIESHLDSFQQMKFNELFNP